MDIRSALPGLRELQDDTMGDSQVCIAVLDGPVDLSHPCFDGAALQRLDTLVQEPAGRGLMSAHGTHVTSLLFGQPGSPIVGIAPRCRGLIIPIFRDDQPGPVSQLDLARAIEQAVQAGANIISVSGGERSPTGHPDSILDRVLRICDDNGILVVAAVGNDGCECLQVPAAFPSVLAVGAIGIDGEPLVTNNWGDPYLTKGVLAPGQSIDGAVPGGSVKAMTGTSFATPVVSGVAALLMSLQRQTGDGATAGEVRDAILRSAIPCHPRNSEECRRHLAGTLNVAAAHDYVRSGGTKAVTNSDDTSVPSPSTQSRVVPNEQPLLEEPVGVAAAGIESADIAASSGPSTPQHGTDNTRQPTLSAADSDDGTAAAASTSSRPEQYPASAPAWTPGPASTGVIAAAECGCGRGAVSRSNQAPHYPLSDPPGHPAPGVVAAGTCGCDGAAPGDPRPLVYAIGRIGFDFGTEARRDSFRQQMEHVPGTVVDEQQSPPGTVFSMIPPNPYNPGQLSDYFKENPWASNKVIWTLNLESTPIYALEAEIPYGMDWSQYMPDEDGQAGGPDFRYPPVSPVYKLFRDALVGHHLPDTDPNYISRVSVPGTLTNRTVRLFSGQLVPVVVVHPRGMYSWNEPELVKAAVDAVLEDAERQRSAGREAPSVDDLTVRQNVRAFLDKVYFQFRNLGQSPPDRALNYAATNAFSVAGTLREGLTSGTYVPGNNVGLYSLDTVSVSKSPYCRPGSDCWDVHLTFFDPENERRARVTYLFTIDVSDELPVSLAPSHRFLVGTPQLQGAWR